MGGNVTSNKVVQKENTYLCKVDQKEYTQLCKGCEVKRNKNTFNQIYTNDFKHLGNNICDLCLNNFMYFDRLKNFTDHIGKKSVIMSNYITFFKLSYNFLNEIVKIDYFDINSTSSEIIKYVDFDYYYNNFFSFYNKYRKVCEFFYYDVNDTIHNAREC